MVNNNLTSWGANVLCVFLCVCVECMSKWRFVFVFVFACTCVPVYTWVCLCVHMRTVALELTKMMLTKRQPQVVGKTHTATF